LIIPANPKSYTLSLHDALPISFDQFVYLIMSELGYVAFCCFKRLLFVFIAEVSDCSKVAMVNEAQTIVVKNLFALPCNVVERVLDRKSTRLNSSHVKISYAVFC